MYVNNRALSLTTGVHEVALLSKFAIQNTSRTLWFPLESMCRPWERDGCIDSIFMPLQASNIVLLSSFRNMLWNS